MQQFADEFGLEVTVCHYPPGTSKWNKIERQGRCQVSGVRFQGPETQNGEGTTGSASSTPTNTAAQSPSPGVTPTLLPTPCVGDCNGNGQVTVDELLTMVNIALGNSDVAACTAGDANADGQITVDEILSAVNNALNGCRM